MSPILIVVLLIQVGFVWSMEIKEVHKFYNFSQLTLASEIEKPLRQFNMTCDHSSEEEIRLQLNLLENSQERSDEKNDDLQTVDTDNSTQYENDSLEPLLSSVVRRPVSDRSEVLIYLTDLANLIHLLLLRNPMSHLLHPAVWKSDLLADVQPQDNFTTIFHKLEDYNRAHQSEDYVVDNQDHFIWVPYSLLKAIHRAIAVEKRLARGRAALRPAPFTLINPGVPIVAKIRERTKCGKYAWAYDRLKKAEEDFFKLTSDLVEGVSEEPSNQGGELRTRFGCHPSGKGVTVVANKLS